MLLYIIELNSRFIRIIASRNSKQLPKMRLKECYELLSSNGMIVKSALLITDNKILLGFTEAEYELL